ncbi:DUF2141 domain-containing protein [Schleiferia thermophila]|jgi:uncharacterized protein (DUF2141 family)|uniref:Uncharacterized protein DUF2141 n=1 Tax=Schleiferia thermophila TaxID=884107 RepID=A0A369A1W9_9FLAO|nr:DUF2141 domain-containing protein [Schleiferia thermophila]KFD39286.1 hypothetical protein AT05_05350 [Schleiferia thermophila str. Yellowstone]RCX03185.1 uncharacterized protein DUF2141 [Schleiferia thermophila]GCD80314.1 hypothetical protein JCM30197_15610 [Schleiferia thermophila]
MKLLQTFILFIGFQFISAQILIVEFDVQSQKDNGKVFLRLKNDQNEIVRESIIPVENKKATIRFTDLSAGSYSVEAFHDQNNNGKLDTNPFGIPKEPYGFSNNVRGNFGPPDFELTLFQVSGMTATKIKIVLR